MNILRVHIDAQDGFVFFRPLLAEELFERPLAQTHFRDDPDARATGFGAALDLARRQDTPLFELRAALDDFELRGPPAREALRNAAGRLVSDGGLPELARAREMLRE